MVIASYSYELRRCRKEKGGGKRSKANYASSSEWKNVILSALFLFKKITSFLVIQLHQLNNYLNSVNNSSFRFCSFFIILR